MQYFEGIDIIESSMNARFNQEGIQSVVKIEKVLISAVNGEKLDEDWDHGDVFKRFDKPTLREELQSLPTSNIVQSRPNRTNQYVRSQ